MLMPGVLHARAWVSIPRSFTTVCSAVSCFGRFLSVVHDASVLFPLVVLRFVLRVVFPLIATASRCVGSIYKFTLVQGVVMIQLD